MYSIEGMFSYNLPNKKRVNQPWHTKITTLLPLDNFFLMTIPNHIRIQLRFIRIQLLIHLPLEQGHSPLEKGFRVIHDGIYSRVIKTPLEPS